ncbi:hypothetical protein, unknown function [Leishmania infantum JPCM5]|uniref:Uncharacterized protein n=2 Tax=Leishmania infantum TaxID=5671 RepID=A4I4K1_LEIIN|nr:hypothetical protein, unknown function [Leishmania infantum JPCM5]CAM69713.1 hypothetical protein, unknown function [Leishmania infantum JPCM5]|eukprot:XP_001466670.1 hypothetical protein, unknown function [Leishmania infantum JPCM5]
MNSQETQCNTGLQKSKSICPPLQVYSGHHQKKSHRHGAHHPSSRATGNRPPVMIPDVKFEVRDPTSSSPLPPKSKPLEQPSSSILRNMSTPSPSHTLNASVRTGDASITSSTPVKDRSINSLHSRAPASQEQRQHSLPTFREAELPLPPRKNSDTRPLRRPSRVPRDVEDVVNAPLPPCRASPQGPTQDSRGARAGLDDNGVHVHMSETALMSILPVEATLTADATDSRVSGEKRSFPTIRVPHQKQGDPRAIHRRDDIGSSSSTPRATGEQRALDPSITALESETVTAHAMQASAVTGSGTALQPHPPLTSVPLASRHPTVVEVLRRPQPAPSAHAGSPQSRALEALGRSALAGPISDTSRMPATDSGASEGNHLLGLLSPHPPASLRPLDTEEVNGGCDGGLQVPPPCSSSRPQSSLSCLISTEDGTEGKSRVDSCVMVCDTQHLPQSDSECLSTPSSTCRRSAYSVNASRNMLEMLPFTDSFVARAEMPSACVRARPTRPLGRRTRSGIAGLLTSFGTPAGTTSSSASVLEHGVAAMRRGNSARTRPSTLEPPPTRSSGSASRATMRVAETSHVLGTAPRPPPSLSSATEEKEDQAREQPPSRDSQKTCNAPALTTPHSPHHPAAHTLTLKAPISDCGVAQSGIAACARRKSMEDQQRKQLRGSCALQHRARPEMCGAPNIVDSVTATPDADAASCIATTPSFTCTTSPQGNATPAKPNSCVSLGASVISLDDSVMGASPGVVAAAAVTTTSESSPATPAAEGELEADAHHRSSLRSLERQQVNPFLRSASILSMRSSSLGRSSPSTAAAGGRSGRGGRGHHGSLPLSFVKVPPLVCGAQGLSFCSLTASGVQAWVEEGAVDAPLDVCVTTLSSLLRKTDSQLRTADSSVCGGSNLLRLIPRSECAAGVGSILRPRSSFCCSHLGLSSRAKRSGSSSLQRTPPPPGPPVNVTNFTNNVSFHHTIFLNSSTRSVVGASEGDAASVATTTTTMTTTAAHSITRSKARVLLSPVGQSSAYQDEEESEVQRDVMIGFASAQDATIATRTVSEEMQPSRLRAMGAMLEHPDAPPFAKAAIQRLHMRCPQLPQTQSLDTHSSPDLLRSGRDDTAAEAPVIVTTTTSIHSCRCMSHSCMAKLQNSSAAAVGTDDPRSQELSATPLDEEVRTGQSSAFLIPRICHDRCHLCDVHKYAKQQQRTTTVLLESVKAIKPQRQNALVPRSIVDANRSVAGCLTATEVHLPKVLPVKRPDQRFSIKRLLGL